MAETELAIPGLTGFVEVGVGGFASVYLADEPDAGRQVAVKVLRAVDDRARERFDRERRTLGMMTEHAHIVTLLRSGFTERGNHPYLVMEYMPDGSLQDRLNRGEQLPVEHAVRLIGQIADALGFAHTTGIVHKDVKPANILLSRNGVAKLTDFGISAVRDSTGTSQMGFSLAYAPPETFHAATADDGRFVDRRDERSDLYSLAATLYALVAGAPPFAAETHATAMHRILTEQPEPSGVPYLDRFFATALAKEPADRFPSAGRFSAELRNSAADPVDQSVPQPPTPPLASPAAAPFPPPTVRIEQTVPIPRQPQRQRMWPKALVVAVGFIGLSLVGLFGAGVFDGPLGRDTGDIPDLSEPAAMEGSGAGHNEPAVITDSTDIERTGTVSAPTTSILFKDAIANTSSSTTNDVSSAGDTDNTNADSVDDPTTDTTIGAMIDAEGQTAPAEEGSDISTAATTATTTTVASNAPNLAEEPRVSAVLLRNTRTNAVVALNGGLFASADFQTGVRIWDRDAPGQDVATYTAHGGGATALAGLSGGLIASGGTYGDGTVHVWNPADPSTTIATYTGHQSGGAVTAVVQLSNGLVVSGDAGGSVHVWDPASPDTTVATYAGHAGVIITKIIQLSSGLVLSNGEGDGAHVWDVNSPGSARAVYSSPGSGPDDTYTYDVVELESGYIASDTLGGAVHVWSPDRPATPIATFTGHNDVGALASLPGGLIASGGDDGQIHIWDPADPNTRLLTYSGHQGPVYSIVELGNGLLASTASNEVHIWSPYPPGP